MKECDVIVVGGGPAGSSCARALVNDGFQVTVLDKAVFPRDKLCAGWVTPPVLEALDIDPAEYAKDHVMAGIKGFRTGIMGRSMVTTRYDDIVSYGVRRCEFDTWLLHRCGADTVQGYHVKKVEFQDDRWIIDDEYSAPMLVGAAGFSCPVVRAIDAKSPRGELAIAAKEVEFELTERQCEEMAVASDTPELFFCEDLKGYGWCFRKDNYINVGIGREDKHGLGGHLEHFVEFLRSSGRLSCDLPDKFPGHAYLIYGHTPRKLLDDHALLIGDAAGLAYPRSGEGIRPAVESGLAAARVITNAGDDYRATSLTGYEEEIERLFGKRQQPAEILPAALTIMAAHLLMKTHWFTRAFMLDRWFLHL